MREIKKIILGSALMMALSTQTVLAETANRMATEIRGEPERGNTETIENRESVTIQGLVEFLHLSPQLKMLFRDKSSKIGTGLLSAQFNYYYDQQKKRSLGRATEPTLLTDVTGFGEYIWGERVNLNNLFPASSLYRYEPKEGKLYLAEQALGSYRNSGFTLHYSMEQDVLDFRLYGSINEVAIEPFIAGINDYFNSDLSSRNDRVTAQNENETIDIGPCFDQACSVIYQQRAKASSVNIQRIVDTYFKESIVKENLPEKLILNIDGERQSFSQIGFHLPIDSAIKFKQYLTHQYGEYNEYQSDIAQSWLSESGEIILNEAHGFGAERNHQYLYLLFNEYPELPTFKTITPWRHLIEKEHLMISEAQLSSIRNQWEQNRDTLCETDDRAVCINATVVWEMSDRTLINRIIELSLATLLTEAEAEKLLQSNSQ